jgi:tetratricopeptide (TPR) repeat protein
MEIAMTTPEERHLLYTQAAMQLKTITSNCTSSTVKKFLNERIHYQDLPNGSCRVCNWSDLLALENPTQDYLAILQILDVLVLAYPTDSYPYTLRARALWGIQYYKAAYEDLQKALIYSPNSIYLEVMLIYSLYFMHKHNEGLEKITDLIQQNSTISELYVVRHYIFRGLAEQSKKDIYLQLAKWDVQKAERLTPLKNTYRYKKLLEQLRTSHTP